ncbi:hypothetical protein B9T33_12710 [Acinetobacter sp. ANC 5054]|uniref:hypothetical protein n=1 Tax=Acinetobacter sp. ANC 5054 TaxID=1977877 RepID=UPI000A354E78|nr:hypothetical protein [Acinetobacter sp. ANC 5054]OTG79336.1 hypothetical protein B9T33_12710 [Acinetobacter sp. ANC 5054]
MKIFKEATVVALMGSAILLSACDAGKEKKAAESQEQSASEAQVINPDVLPYLNIQEQAAKVAKPFCENKSCIDLDIQTIHTVDTWLNSWIEKNQATVIQDQIGSKQNMSLQQAVNAYVKKSDAWQAELNSNKPYELALYTRVPYQRNQYVLLQIGVDNTQENITVKERYYFFVADRRSRKNLTPLDIVDAKQQQNMNALVQTAYGKWLDEQSVEVKKTAPKKLYWGQADWFFDQEGIGLHYRTDEIVKEGKQLDIYLTKVQTQQVLKADVYQHMF